MKTKYNMSELAAQAKRATLVHDVVSFCSLHALSERTVVLTTRGARARAIRAGLDLAGCGALVEVCWCGEKSPLGDLYCGADTYVVARPLDFDVQALLNSGARVFTLPEDVT